MTVPVLSKVPILQLKETISITFTVCFQSYYLVLSNSNINIKSFMFSFLFLEDNIHQCQSYQRTEPIIIVFSFFFITSPLAVNISSVKSLHAIAEFTMFQ